MAGAIRFSIASWSTSGRERRPRKEEVPDELFYDILTRLLNTDTQSPCRILDVGCGTDYIARYFVDRVERVDAVDCYQIARNYDEFQLTSLMEQLAHQATPFSLQAGGVALFTGLHPVLYVPIVRTIELSHFHQKVWQVNQLEQLLLRSSPPSILCFKHLLRWHAGVHC